MDIRAGDRVWVNLAPFIGMARRSKDSIPCEVTAVEGTQVQVAVKPPYRRVELWVEACWIDAAPRRAALEHAGCRVDTP